MVNGNLCRGIFTSVRAGVRKLPKSVLAGTNATTCPHHTVPGAILKRTSRPTCLDHQRAGIGRGGISYDRGRGFIMVYKKPFLVLACVGFLLGLMYRLNIVSDVCHWHTIPIRLFNRKSMPMNHRVYSTAAVDAVETSFRVRIKLEA